MYCFVPLPRFLNEFFDRLIYIIIPQLVVILWFHFSFYLLLTWLLHFSDRQ